MRFADPTTKPRASRFVGARASRASVVREGAPWTVLSGAVLVGIVALSACQHPKSETTAVAPPAAEPVAVAAAEFHEGTFDLVLRPLGPYASGKAGTAEIQLVPKGGYHCNDRYPYKFKVSNAPGVTFGAPVFTKDAVQLEPMRAVMKVGFTPESKGEKTLAGVFSFSLCSADRCLVEKRDLSLRIPVD